MYLSVQAALEVVCVRVAPDDDIASLEIDHTKADSAEPDRASPK
jgi:hypothetical protein